MPDREPGNAVEGRVALILPHDLRYLGRQRRRGSLLAGGRRRGRLGRRLLLGQGGREADQKWAQY